LTDDLLHTPQQGRSRETLTRILEAAEALMSAKPFEKITVAEIVKKAKTTTGSFYARFPDKAALLESMHAQHVAESVTLLKKQMDQMEGLPPKDRIKALVSIVGSVFRKRPALMRSGTLMFWNNMSSTTAPVPSSTLHLEFADQIKRVRHALEKISQEIGNPKAKAAANFALKISLSASRQHYLFSDDRTILSISNQGFERELSAMVFAYLTHGE